MKSRRPVSMYSGNRKRRRVRKGRLILAGVLILLFSIGVISVAGKAIKAITSAKKSSVSSVAAGSSSSAPSEEPELYEIDGRINVLVMGVDSSNPGKERDGVYYPRSDTMMLMSMDTKTNSAFMLSIPRDIKITIGGATGKLNAVYRRGGPELAMRAAEQILGVKLNKYMVVSYQAVEKTVDDLGGIEFDVPRDMNYTDDYCDPPLKINLKKGVQLLDGDKAMQLLRYRKAYKDGDLGRIHVQQNFLKAVINKALSPSSIVHIPSYIDTMMKYVNTDINVLDMLTYAHYAQKLSLEDMEKQTLAGDWNEKTNRFEVDEEKAVEQIRYLLSGNYQKEETGSVGTAVASGSETAAAKSDKVQVLPPASSDSKQTSAGEDAAPLESYTPDKTPVIYIDNGSGKTGAAGRAGDLLKINSLSVSNVGNAKESNHEKTIIYYKEDERLAHKIQMLLEAGEVQQADSIPGKKGYTIYVLVGKDFKK